MACIRINQALVKAKVDSKMLVLYKTINSNLIVDYRKELSPLKSLHLKIKNRNYVDLLRWKNRKNNELFSVYHSVWDPENHSLVQSADVINLHWVAGFVNFESFLKANNKKIVFTLHDFFPFSGGPHYPNDGFKAEAWQKEIKKNLELLKKAYLPKNIHFVGPSQYIIDEVKRSGAADHAKFSVVKNPIDTSIYKILDRVEIRKQFGFTENDKVLLYINERFKYKRKGFTYFKPMIRQLLAKGYKIIISGDHSRSLDGNENIIQTKYIGTENELARIYNAADVLLFTSLNDNLPNTLSESMCCGTPVISFNNGGISEMIEDGRNGFLVADKNRGEFLKKIDQFFASNISRDLVSKNAHQTYAPETAAKKYLEIYND